MGTAMTLPWHCHEVCPRMPWKAHRVPRMVTWVPHESALTTDGCRMADPWNSTMMYMGDAWATLGLTLKTHRRPTGDPCEDTVDPRATRG